MVTSDVELQTDLFQKVPRFHLRLPGIPTWNYSGWELFIRGGNYDSGLELFGVGSRGWSSGFGTGWSWSGPAHLDLEMFPTRLLLCGLWGVRFRVVHRQSVVCGPSQHRTNHLHRIGFVRPSLALVLLESLSLPPYCVTRVQVIDLCRLWHHQCSPRHQCDFLLRWRWGLTLLDSDSKARRTCVGSARRRRRRRHRQRQGQGQGGQSTKRGGLKTQSRCTP